MMRILIADDHAVVRKGLKQIITDDFPSAEIIEVGDVESLLVHVIKANWDVIICDISMPGRSGVEALEQIKQIKPCIPVLMLSMHSEDQYAMRVLKAGAAGYLNKSTVHEDLIRAIQVVRLGRKYITPSIAERLADLLSGSDREMLHENLSNREFEIFKMIASGKSISEIAEQLSLSPTTVSTYRSRILEKMSIRSNADITKYALENGLI